MATTTDFIDNTTATAFIPELWSMLAIVAREDSLVFAQLVDRRFEQNLSFGDTVHVPSVGNLAARTKALSSNAAITYETITETNKDISIATWEYAAIAVESIVKIQNNRDQLKMYGGKLGYALGLAVDDVLAGLPDDFTNTVGTLAVENTDDEWLRARQYLNDANAPYDGRAIVIAPAAETGLLKLDRFVNSDYAMIHGNESPQTSLERAYVTSWYRTPVYMSVNTEGTNAAGHDNTMFQRDALALVMQEKPKLYQQFDIDYLVDKVAMEQIYGVLEMRDDHGVWVKGA